MLPWQCTARYPELSQDVLFVDVDFPELIEKKRKVVLATPELRQLLGSYQVGADGSPIYLQSEKYCQIGCDLRQLDLLRGCLSTVIGSPASEGSFLFVAEVSITYMETLAADQVIQWASTLGNGSTTTLFVQPLDSFAFLPFCFHVSSVNPFFVARLLSPCMHPPDPSVL